MIYLGSDHAGFRLKETIKKYLGQLKEPYQDLGNHHYDPNDDYPDFSYQVAFKVGHNPRTLGILFCGSAQGACITANKVKGVRAASVKTVAEAILAREHDDVNIICLAGGGQIQKKFRGLGISSDIAKKIVNAWLGASFSQERRHRRRVNKIKKIEAKNFC